MRFSVLVSILGAISLTACLSGDDHDSDRHPGHVPVATPPELPRLTSKQLTKLETAKLARSATRMGEGDSTGSLERVSGNRKIVQKVLLLGATGNEPAFLAAKSALDRIGVPYRALIAASETVTDALLSDGVSTCNFNGVIVATSSLGYVDPNGAWTSAMDPAEWQSLADFEAACSARELTWYGWPGAEYGLAPVAGFDWTTPVDATLTAAGKAQFVRVKDSATVNYRNAAGYRATVADPATTTALVTDAGGNVLVASHTAADGREMMVSTVDASPYLAHSLVLEYDFVRWVTRGVFVGKKRAYMGPQIDDLFLANDMWNDATHANDPTVQFRITGTDLTAFATWQRNFQGRLPAGSSFNTWLAFNGIGTLTSEYPDATLLAAARNAGPRLSWMNHTWDHENLDNATRAEARAEVLDNCRLAAQTYRLHQFNCNELVSPDVSGLLNVNALAGMVDAGVLSVVSDTSITEAIRPQAPGTNPSFNVGRTNPLNPRIYQVPRHPTSIFYDVSTPATASDEYNTIYRSYYGRDLSYLELLDKDSEFGLFYLLQGDVDPLMFHQANLRNYGGGRSIYGDWVEAVAAKYLAYFDAPIQTLRQNAISNEMQARGRFNACGLTATILEGTPKILELRATKACVVPVTGLSSSTYGSVENYGGEPTTSITMAAGQVKQIPLSTAVSIGF